MYEGIAGMPTGLRVAEAPARNQIGCVAAGVETGMGAMTALKGATHHDSGEPKSPPEQVFKFC